MTRRSLFLAATLSLAACTPAPAPVAVPTPGASASSLPSALPSASAAPSQAPTTAPSTTPAPATGGTLKGQAFGIDDAPLAGVAIRARSLDASLPWEAAATTDAAGAWSIAGVPIGAQIEVRATKAGWTPRVQLGGVGTDGPATIDFGGATARFAGAFMSPYPEITAVSPLADGTLRGDGSLTYAVTLSEPLDAANRQRFEQAFAILPADIVATGGTGTAGAIDLRGDEDRYPLERVVAGAAPYRIAAGTAFRSERGARARLDWSQDGLTATLRFNAPLCADKAGDARYQAVLTAGAEAIRDAEGLPLGTGPTGALGSSPAAGGLVLGAFRTRDLQLPAVEGLAAGTPAARWAATHDNVAGFLAPSDETTPQLAEARVTAAGGDTQLLLTFSEPLAAHDGRADGKVGAGTGQAADHLPQVSFAVGDRRDLEALKLEGVDDGDVRLLDPGSLTAIGADDADQRRELAFAAGAWAADAADATAGQVTMGLDPDDARILMITLHGRSRFFDRGLRAIKVRVEGVTDPAGNERSRKTADANPIIADL